MAFTPKPACAPGGQPHRCCHLCRQHRVLVMGKQALAAAAHTVPAQPHQRGGGRFGHSFIAQLALPFLSRCRLAPLQLKPGLQLHFFLGLQLIACFQLKLLLCFQVLQSFEVQLLLRLKLVARLRLGLILNL